MPMKGYTLIEGCSEFGEYKNFIKCKCGAISTLDCLWCWKCNNRIQALQNIRCKQCGRTFKTLETYERHIQYGRGKTEPLDMTQTYKARSEFYGTKFIPTKEMNYE